MNKVTSLRSLLCLSSAVRLLMAGALFLPTAVPAAWGKPKADFSNYDVALYEQIVNHIKAKVAARLGKGPLTHDRFFIIPFAYQNDGNDPEFSHSFITVIRVFADGRRSKNSEFMAGTYRRWNFEAFNISWLPSDFPENPHLCVFHGVGSRIFPKMNSCPVSPGKNFSLRQTIQLAVNAKVDVGMWGPYEIAKEAFERGVKRKRLLDTGKIKYRADDRLYRKDHTAINCFHAMASLDDPFPNGGAFGTGFKMWGLNGTSRVLIEYRARTKEKGLLMEPIDVKKDRYGFVYVPAGDERHVYNPFQNASAYRR